MSYRQSSQRRAIYQAKYFRKSSARLIGADKIRRCLPDEFYSQPLSLFPRVRNEVRKRLRTGGIDNHGPGINWLIGVADKQRNYSVSPRATSGTDIQQLRRFRRFPFAFPSNRFTGRCGTRWILFIAPPKEDRALAVYFPANPSVNGLDGFVAYQFQLPALRS